MAFVGIKQIGQKQMKFNADGSVELINASGSLEVSAPQKPAPQQMVEQVVEKAKEMVGMKPAPEMEAEKPKARRGRSKKASAE